MDLISIHVLRTTNREIRMSDYCSELRREMARRDAALLRVAECGSQTVLTVRKAASKSKADFAEQVLHVKSLISSEIDHASVAIGGQIDHAGNEFECQIQNVTATVNSQIEQWKSDL